MSVEERDHRIAVAITTAAGTTTMLLRELNQQLIRFEKILFDKRNAK